MPKSVPHVVDVDVAANLTQGLDVPSTSCVCSGSALGDDVVRRSGSYKCSQHLRRRPACMSHKRVTAPATRARRFHVPERFKWETQLPEHIS